MRDSKGRKKDPRGTDIYGACRCCGRWFVDQVADPLTEARHDSDGFCSGCATSARRSGTGTPTCRHDFPGSAYKCGFTTEQNARHVQLFLHRIAGTSERLRQCPPDPNCSRNTPPARQAA